MTDMKEVSMDAIWDNVDVVTFQNVARISGWLMVASGAMTMLVMLFITAPYGKFAKQKGWGIMIPPTTAWMIMESPNLWIPFALLAMLPINIARHSFVSLPTLLSPFEVLAEPSHYFQNPNFVLLSLFLLHYVHRDIIFPQFLSTSNPMPISIMLAAFIFCSWNAINQALTLFFVQQYDTASWWASPQTITGIALFFLGMSINIYSDYSLISQKTKGQQKGVQYIVPQGFWFDFVSCPNYSKIISSAEFLYLSLHVSMTDYCIFYLVGEILEWFGFALAANNLAAWSFAWYTTSNLLPRALAVSKTFGNLIFIILYVCYLFTFMLATSVVLAKV